jgi:hypothetical protein
VSPQDPPVTAEPLTQIESAARLDAVASQSGRWQRLAADGCQYTVSVHLLLPGRPIYRVEIWRGPQFVIAANESSLMRAFDHALGMVPTPGQDLPTALGRAGPDPGR